MTCVLPLRAADSGLRMLHTLGAAMALSGWLLVVAACCLPAWKVAAVGAARPGWTGLWASCVEQSGGRMRCQRLDSVLALPRDLQAARGLTLLSLVTGLCGAGVSVLGGRCVRCVENERSRAQARVLAGSFFAVSGCLCLVSVSWSAYATVAGAGADPLTAEARSYALGAALFMGWAAAALLLAGGGLLCVKCPPRREHAAGVVTFTPVSSTTSKEGV
ncbi:claudin-4-like [Betta splendens]|uniref:Claudin-4-like n=1 Tax=Betta splendens TaxID=158456 RepID=A0A6P7P4D9_BETSP|nr:claudin-4-like [Betta splendens]